MGCFLDLTQPTNIRTNRLLGESLVRVVSMSKGIRQRDGYYDESTKRWPSLRLNPVDQRFILLDSHTQCAQGDVARCEARGLSHLLRFLILPGVTDSPVASV